MDEQELSRAFSGVGHGHADPAAHPPAGPRSDEKSVSSDDNDRFLFEAARQLIKNKDAEGLRGIVGTITQDNRSALLAVSFRRIESAIQNMHNYYRELYRPRVMRDMNREKSLHEKRAAAFVKFKTLSDILCDAGAEIGHRNFQGRNFFHKAALWGAADVIEWAVVERKFTDIDARVENQGNADEHGFTALHLACAEKNMDAVLMLLKLGADFKALTPDGREPGQLIPYDDMKDEFYTACQRILAARSNASASEPPPPIA